MPDLELTPPVFAILSSLIEERVGLSYTMQDQGLLASKLSLRATEIGFDSLLDYYYFLRYDAGNEGEFEALVNSLVVNGTYFFREFEALQVIVTQFVAPLISAGRTPRIWCAACSTGEEPLTLAMLLAQRDLLDKVELIASDISSAALSRARAGEHGRRSLRHVPAPELLEKWLEVHEHGVSVHPALRRAVIWKQLNLLDEAAIEAIGPVDIILCRNVLIYFRDVMAAKVVKALGGQLCAGGVLLVGVSESLLRFGTSLACEEHGGVFLYRKSPS
jgi:chemotaxis protein methyltransferase CheR